MKSKRQNRNSKSAKPAAKLNPMDQARARAAAEEARIKKLVAEREAAQTPKPPPAPKSDGMKLSRAKDLLEFGVVRGVEITTNPMASGWILQLAGRSGEMHTLETDRGGVRVFKTLDAAFKLCEEIGFETALVVRKRAMLHGH